MRPGHFLHQAVRLFLTKRLVQSAFYATINNAEVQSLSGGYMPFPRHGEFRIQVDGRIVRSELVGPWNIETARDYIRQLDMVVEHELTGQRWASLVVCLQSILFPLDMIAPLRASIQARVAKTNQAAVAMVVAPEVEGYRVLHPTIRRIYDGLIPFEIFDTLEDAQAWLARMLVDESA
jgi:hypothetical protein